jgi:exonuclease-1
MFDKSPSVSHVLTLSRKRAHSKTTGLDLLKLGRTSQAHLELQKSIDVTPTMARHIINACTAVGVKCLVAPYEADSQLYYLEKKGIIDAVVSEDSDLLVFGVRTLITKLDQFGGYVEINRDHFTACKDVSLAGWTPTQFRHMCILSGCDYLDNIPSMGLKTAHRLMRRYSDVEKVLRALKFDGKMKVPEGYFEAFKRADMTFQYQRVFCPVENRIVMANDPEPETTIDDEILVYIGPDIDIEIARGVASGQLDPMTKQPILIPKSTPKASPFAKQWTPTSQFKKFETPTKSKPIKSFFKPKSEARPAVSTPLLRAKDINSLAALTTMSAPARTFSAPMSTKRILPASLASESKKPRLALSDGTSAGISRTAISPATAERSSFFKAQSRRPMSTPTPKPRMPVLVKEKIPPVASVSITFSVKDAACKSPPPSVPKRVAHESPAMPSGGFLPGLELDSEVSTDDAVKKVAQGWKERYAFSSQDGGKKLSEVIEKQRQSSMAPRRISPLQQLRDRTFGNPRRTVPSASTASMPLLLSSQSSTGGSSEESQDSDSYLVSAGGSAASSQGTGLSVDVFEGPEDKMFGKFAYGR